MRSPSSLCNIVSVPYFLVLCEVRVHVRWVPFHHDMARPQVADGDGLQIWRVAANILNKQSRREDMERPSSFTA
jgi:hypothetical protein